jgi:hypothetical protein
MSYEIAQTTELQRLNAMADEIAKNEMRVNVTEPASTDNLVFSGDEFHIRTDNREIQLRKEKQTNMEILSQLPCN